MSYIGLILNPSENFDFEFRDICRFSASIRCIKSSIQLAQKLSIICIVPDVGVSEGIMHDDHETKIESRVPDSLVSVASELKNGVRIVVVVERLIDHFRMRPHF